MIKPIVLKLTLAQLEFAGIEIGYHCSIGDCSRKNLTLTFPDYEGANSFRNGILCLRTPTTRSYVSWSVIIEKLDTAILKATGRAPLVSDAKTSKRHQIKQMET